MVKDAIHMQFDIMLVILQLQTLYSWPFNFLWLANSTFCGSSYHVDILSLYLGFLIKIGCVCLSVRQRWEISACLHNFMRIPSASNWSMMVCFDLVLSAKQGYCFYLCVFLPTLFLITKFEAVALAEFVLPVSITDALFW